MTRRRRYGARGALALLVGTLAVVAAGCGGDDSSVERAGGSRRLARRGPVDGQGGGAGQPLVWPGYADKSWADTFTQNTGCKVNTKDFGTSDDAIDLIASGEWDGLSASGNATGRLIAKGDVAAVDTDLLPNYADIAEGLKNQPYNSVDGQAYGAPHGRGPNLLVFRTDEVTPSRTAGRPSSRRTRRTRASCPSTTTRRSSRTLPCTCKATQPDLGIENPYQLNEEQFKAAVDLLKSLAPNVGEWWADYAKQIQSITNKDSSVGTTWPFQINTLVADKQPVKAHQAEGGHDRVVGHLDDLLQGRQPELHVPLDGLHHVAGGAGEGRGVLR